MLFHYQVKIEKLYSRLEGLHSLQSVENEVICDVIYIKSVLMMSLI